MRIVAGENWLSWTGPRDSDVTPRNASRSSASVRGPLNALERSDLRYESVDGHRLKDILGGGIAVLH